MNRVDDGSYNVCLTPQAMASPLHFLLLAVSLPVVMAMPEPVSTETWEPPPGPAPPLLPFPPMDDLYGDNMTVPAAGALQAYCQALQPG